jgi:hypothetical protein
MQGAGSPEDSTQLRTAAVFSTRLPKQQHMPCTDISAINQLQQTEAKSSTSEQPPSSNGCLWVNARKMKPQTAACRAVYSAQHVHHETSSRTVTTLCTLPCQKQPNNKETLPHAWQLVMWQHH